MSGDLLLALLGFFPMLYMSHFAHELGHTLMGRWHGQVISSFGMGTAHPFWVRSWRGTRVFLCRTRPLQGITFFINPEIFAPRKRMAWGLAGGALANGVLAVAALGMCWLLPLGRGLWLPAAGYNGLLFIVSFLPSTSRIGTFTLRSDGAQILRLLRRETLALSAPLRIRLTRGLSGLWESIGDRVALHLYSLDTALAWMELEETEQAAAACAKAEQLSSVLPFQRAFAVVVRGMIAREAGQLEASACALEEAEKQFRDLNHKAGLFLVDLGRAELLLHRGDAAGAVTGLESLACHSLIAEWPELQTALLVLHLAAQVTLADAPGVERLRAQYEAVPRRFRSWTNDFHVFKMLGNWYAQQANWARAASVLRRALRIAQSLCDALPEGAEQAHFWQKQGGLLAQTKACLRQRGYDNRAEEIDTLFSGPEQRPRELAVLQEQRDRPYLRLGLLLTFVNAACALGTIAASATFEEMAQVLFESRSGGIWLLLIGLQATYCFFTLLLWPVIAVAGRLLPTVRRHRGKVILGLALLPWLSWLAGIVIAASLGELF